MYRVECDDKALHDVRDDNYMLVSPKVTLELNKTGGFDFGILATHPNNDCIEKLKSRISVYEDDDLLFRGRSLTDEVDFQNTGQVSCEGELAFLLDSVQRPHTYGSQSGETNKARNNVEIFKRLIQEHNSQVEAEKQFQIGVVDIDSVEIKSLSTNYEKTWDFINSNFLGTYSGYLRVRYAANVRYIDYVKQYGNVSNQCIQFGENLLDLKKYTKAENLKTAIIPIGANNVTIKTATGHDGTDYVYSKEAVNLYGWVFDKVDFSDASDPNTLLSKAKEYLSSAINLAITIELTAVDLHMVDVDINSIRLGDLVPCISKQHGLLSTMGDASTYYLVSKYEIDLENPANNKITLGRTVNTLTDTISASGSGGIIQTIEQQVNNMAGAVQETNSQVETIKKEMDSVIGKIYPVGSIYMTVDDVNPMEILGGTWERWGNGMVPIGVDESDADFNSSETTGGAKAHLHSTGNHTLTTNEMPSHTHELSQNLGLRNVYGTGGAYAFASASSTCTVRHSGGNQPHNHGNTGNATNLQPYITCYMWKRTA